MTDIFNTAAVQASGISAGHPLAVILSSRDDILIMTEQAYDATLKPDNPGGISHGERAALCSSGLGGSVLSGLGGVGPAGWKRDDFSRATARQPA